MMSRTKEILKEELQKVVRIDSESLSTPSLAYGQEEVGSHQIGGKSALQELSYKIELCLEKQKRLRFITKEIAEIIKKSS